MRVRKLLLEWTSLCRPINVPSTENTSWSICNEKKALSDPVWLILDRRTVENNWDSASEDLVFGWSFMPLHRRTKSSDITEASAVRTPNRETLKSWLQPCSVVFLSVHKPLTLPCFSLRLFLIGEYRIAMLVCCLVFIVKRSCFVMASTPPLCDTMLWTL